MLAFRDQIADGHHWTTFDPGRADRRQGSPTRRRSAGTAHLQGRRMDRRADMTSTPVGPKPAHEPKFDAEVTFDAVP